MRLLLIAFPLFLVSLSLPGCSARKTAPKLPPVNAPNQNPFLFPCRSQSGEGPLEFSGSLLLHRAFLPRANQERVFREAIREQLKFLTGYFENDVNREETKIFLSSREPEIEILARQTTEYGLALSLDPLPHSNIPYVEAALARGLTKITDPAWRIFYRAKVMVSFCAEPSAGPLLATLSLPMDPYLAPWLVAKEARRKLEFHGAKTLANPCASPAIAALPFTQYYWWVYDPAAKGTDADGRAFDCSTLLKPDVALGTFFVKMRPAQFLPPQKLGAPLLSQKGPLRVTLIFGPTQYLFSAEPEVRAAYAALSRPRALESLSAYLDQVRPAEQHLHPEAFRFLRFLSGLAETVHLDRQETVQEKSHLRLAWTGHLKDSKRELRIRIYFGGTDNTPGAAAEHWPFVLEALAQDDILLYFGRAGLGLNMSLQQLSESLKIPPAKLRKALAAKRYQLVSVIAPHAYTFFGSDLVDARKKLGKKQRTDLLLATTFGKPDFFLGLFSYLDARLSGRNPGWAEWAAPRLDQDEMFFFSSP